MNAQLNWGSGRRWFGAAALLVLTIVLVALLQPAARTAAQGPESTVLLISAPVSGRVGGVAFAPGDILLHRMGTDEWEMFFDASDIGITRNVTAFAYGYGGVLYLALSGSQPIPGLGIIWPQDVIAFYPDTLGPVTSGTLWPTRLRALKKEIGLQSSGEAIDAIGDGTDGGGGFDYTLSTKENFSLRYWDDWGSTFTCAGRDEDVLFYWLDDEGGTRSVCGLILDGSAVPGLAREDIVGLSKFVDDGSTRTFYIVIGDSFRVAGIAGGPDDILAVQKNADGTFQVSKVWDGRADGFPYALDGIDILYPIYAP